MKKKSKLFSLTRVFIKTVLVDCLFSRLLLKATIDIKKAFSLLKIKIAFANKSIMSECTSEYMSEFSYKINHQHKHMLLHYLCKFGYHFKWSLESENRII